MAHHGSRSIRQDLALEISSRLSEAADRLEFADNPEAFTAAVEGNREVWLRLSHMSQRVDYVVPERLMRASLSVPSGGRGLDDHRIELLIKIDRHVSAAIAESATV